MSPGATPSPWPPATGGLPSATEPRRSIRLPQLSIRHLWIVAVLWFVFFFASTPASFQNDLWQHLAAGREMIASGRILRAETFSHTAHGAAWLNQNWFAQVAFAECAALGGVAAVVFFTAVLYTTSFALVARICWRRSRHYRITALCTLLGITLGLENLGVRPQTFTAFCLSAELCLLWDVRPRRRTPLLVALILVLWTNTHGAFPVGMVLPFMFLAARLLTLGTQHRWRQAWSDPWTRMYAACALLAVGAAFCNPDPAHTMGYVTASLQKSAELSFQEWQPNDFHSITGVAFYGSIALGLLILNFSRRRMDATEAILVVVFLLLGAQAVRMVIWWGFVLAPLLAAHLSNLFGRETVRPVPGFKLLLNYTMVTIVGALSVLTLPGLRQHNPFLPEARRAVRPLDEPFALVAFLKEHRTAGNIFNPMEWGGYLMWHAHDQLRIFADPRIDPYSDQVWKDYLHAMQGTHGWEDVLDRYQVTTVVASQKFTPALLTFIPQSRRWREVYRDSLGAVFERCPDADGPVQASRPVPAGEPA